MSSLESRRLKSDLIFCYKIIHNYVSVDYSDMFELDHKERTRGHTFKQRSKAPRLNSRLVFFGCRIVKVWNDLPPWCAEATTDIVFKSLLNTVNLSKYLCNDHDKLYFDFIWTSLRAVPICLLICFNYVGKLLVSSDLAWPILHHV